MLWKLYIFIPHKEVPTFTFFNDDVLVTDDFFCMLPVLIPFKVYSAPQYFSKYPAQNGTYPTDQFAIYSNIKDI